MFDSIEILFVTDVQILLQLPVTDFSVFYFLYLKKLTIVHLLWNSVTLWSQNIY